jgi:hypothetical protein
MLNLKIADIVEDEELMRLSRAAVIGVLKEDPSLVTEKNYMLRKELSKKSNGGYWSKIS